MSKQSSQNTNLGRSFHSIDECSSFSTVEAYKVGRTNLKFKLVGENENKKCVVFTSAGAAEGKTTTCINLAITFAQSGSKVLIVDADMRRPMVHKYMNIQSKPGLSDKICGFAEDDPCIYRCNQENLFVMPAGTIPPNPAELLMSNRFDAFLKIFATNFDYVFIDSPPVGVVTDATIIATKVDGAIFVVRQNVTRKEQINEAKRMLEQAGANILGFLLNDVKDDSARKKYYKGHYYKKYGYYKYSGQYGNTGSSDD